MRVVITALLCFASSSAVAARETNSAGVGLRWDATDVVLHRDTAFPSRQSTDAEVNAAIDAAMAAWSTNDAARVTLTRGAPVTGDAAQPLAFAAASVRFVSDKWVHPALYTELAYTTWQADADGTITSVVVLINEATRSFTLDGVRTSEPRYDLGAVLTHEFGHVLGLAHSHDDGATMFASTAPWDIHQRVPTADDWSAYASIYGDKADAPTAATIAPATGCTLGADSAPANGTALLFCMWLLVALRRAYFKTCAVARLR